MHYNSLKNGIEEKGNTESEVINTVTHRMCAKQQGERECLFQDRRMEVSIECQWGKGAMFKTSWKMTQTEVMMRPNGSVQSEGPEHNCWQPVKDFWQAAGRDRRAVTETWLWSPSWPRVSPVLWRWQALPEAASDADRLDTDANTRKPHPSLFTVTVLYSGCSWATGLTALLLSHVQTPE